MEKNVIILIVVVSVWHSSKTAHVQSFEKLPVRLLANSVTSILTNENHKIL